MRNLAMVGAIIYALSAFGGCPPIPPFLNNNGNKGGGCRTKRKIKHKGFGKSKFLNRAAKY